VVVGIAVLVSMDGAAVGEAVGEAGFGQSSKSINEIAPEPFRQTSNLAMLERPLSLEVSLTTQKPLSPTLSGLAMTDKVLPLMSEICHG
jgi:hypothetical protein